MLITIRTNGRAQTRPINTIKRSYESKALLDFAEAVGPDEPSLTLESYGHTPFVC